ncbi:MAG: hypothetical protein GX957_10195 [Clostridiaceae bacterium]|nr:hypothetical protein [Clostridiaceae bacterium]
MIIQTMIDVMNGKLGSGWRKLYKSYLDRLSELGVGYTIPYKCCGYLEIEYDAEIVDPENREEVSEVIAELRMKSRYTCQVCGRTGSAKRLNGSKILCHDCFVKIAFLCTKIDISDLLI